MLSVLVKRVLLFLHTNRDIRYEKIPFLLFLLTFNHTQSGSSSPMEESFSSFKYNQDDEVRDLYIYTN
jgi:hypothetical protein